MITEKELWKPLPFNEWKDTAMTLHLFTQIIGKIRLGLMPMSPEWAQVPLTVSSRGIISTGMPAPFGSVDIVFDFISHTLNFYASNSEVITFSLKDLSVAMFYKKVKEALDKLGIKVKINPMSVEMPASIKMDTDENDKTYDSEFVGRWWLTLVIVQNIFNKFRSRFAGKVSPVNFFWGSFDLAITFFSGKFVDPQPGMDLIYRVAMDAEQSTIGFWGGNELSPEPVFFAYTYPKPEGFENADVMPSSAYWSTEKGEFILHYEDVRNSDDPEKTLLDFCESTYKAGTSLARWDLKTLEHKPPIKKPGK